MFLWPSRRSRLMARLRSVAITRGAFPVLTRDLSFLVGDVADPVDGASHCSLTVGGWLEQAVLGGWQLDTQAFPASGADVDGAQLAALDTLQHGLPGDAEGGGGDLDGDPACGRVAGDEIPDRGGEADLPGGAGGDLLGADESVVEPPVEGGGGDAELGGRLVHAHH